jgi:type IV pilus assembly protein PilF
MRIATMALLSVAFSLVAGCVTEGAPLTEPASPEEAAAANLALGVGYVRQNRPELAIEALQRAIEQQPRSVDAQSTLAVAYDMIGEYELAEEHHRRATQLAPSEPDVQNRFAVYLCRQDRWQDAAPYFERAVDNMGNGNPVSVMLNAATCAAAAGNLVAAETYYRAALDVENANAAALRGMVDVSIRGENYLPGRAFWQRLERGATLEAQDLLSCYVIETELGDRTAAGSCAGRLQREFPGSPALRQLRDLEQNGN